ncbi:MAG: hypothetical protein KAS38_09880 [Anaerolineales bacterium]|nr:hypothetical protein [Anaerolineales bacterium]
MAPPSSQHARSAGMPVSKIPPAGSDRSIPRLSRMAAWTGLRRVNP